MAETILLRSTADRSLTTHNKLGQFGLDAAISTVPSHLSCSHALLSLGHVLKKKVVLECISLITTCFLSWCLRKKC